MTPRLPRLCSHRRALSPVFLGTLLALLVSGCSGGYADKALRYELDYDISIDGADATVMLTVRQTNGELKRITLVGELARSAQSSNGPLAETTKGLEWQVPATGGQLTWASRIDHVRQSGSRDAGVNEHWGLFRAEDLIPPIASVTAVGADATTRLRLQVPAGWSVVTPYRRGADGWYGVEDSDRRFDKPDGWILIGDIGVRRDLIAGIETAVAAPRGASARRLDTLAFLRWHLPHLRALFPAFPDRLLIAIAPDPYFRGGLSAPNSLYMHVERPLISGNGTSTILHELFHVGLGGRAIASEDWIVEGLAEYYSLELLRRAGSISEERHSAGLAQLREWGSKASTLRAPSSRGPTTALAASVFARLDEEIRTVTGGNRSLDGVVQTLARDSSALSLAQLRRAAAAALEQPAATLTDENLPGYAKD